TQPNSNLNNATSQGSASNTRLDTWNVQFNQNVSTGGAIVASLNSNRTDTNQVFALFSPQYNTTSSIQFTQPLLRNRQIDQNRGTIKLANLDLKINDTQFKLTVTNTIATIQGVYWDLAYAIRNYNIVRESVKLAQVTVDQNREKVRIGTMSDMDVTVAQASVASRLVDLVSAQQTINVAENNLRSTISSDRKSEIWQKVIVPTDSTDFVDHKAELESSLDTALKNRPELQQYDLQMQENDISYAVNRSLKKWQLDAVGSFGTAGINVDNGVVGGVGTAYETLFTKGFKNWFVGFNIQIPLRNRSLEGQLGQLKVQKSQLLMNRKSQEQKIAVQIRNAVDDLESNKQKVEAAKVARQLAEAQLDAENKRFNVGMSQNFLVLQRQTDLSTAQGAELQALVAYKKSLITLQQDMFTLLESSDFEIVESGSAHRLN
ncbi:MAG TPA: TolC family protein, partial [Acidobacteriota bacterium]|nr:TolC family protein [Acidobacteriota bacterium]